MKVTQDSAISPSREQYDAEQSEFAAGQRSQRHERDCRDGQSERTHRDAERDHRQRDHDQRPDRDAVVFFSACRRMFARRIDGAR